MLEDLWSNDHGVILNVRENQPDLICQVGRMAGYSDFSASTLIQWPFWASEVTPLVEMILFHVSSMMWAMLLPSVTIAITPTRWGPLPTISGFIPSYAHLQPWLNRVCWGYNYLITRGGSSCIYNIYQRMFGLHHWTFTRNTRDRMVWTMDNCLQNGWGKKKWCCSNKGIGCQEGQWPSGVCDDDVHDDDDDDDDHDDVYGTTVVGGICGRSDCQRFHPFVQEDEKCHVDSVCTFLGNCLHLFLLCCRFVLIRMLYITQSDIIYQYQSCHVWEM